MEAVGIVTLPINMLCLVESLTIYEAVISDIPVKLHFPRYERPENLIMGSDALKPPVIAEDIHRGEDDIDWGIANKQTLEATGCTVKAIAVECNNEDIQRLYDSFDSWLIRFQQYCFLCNRQFLNATESTSSGGCHLEMVGEQGYISPENPPMVRINLQMLPEEVFLKKQHIEKAIDYASSGKHIRPEYEFMQQAYEAEEKHLHRLSIVNACSALEMCLMKQIDEKLAALPADQVPEGKRRYLDQLVEYMGKLDIGFRRMEQDIKTEVIEVRNDILHQNRNPYPTRKMAFDAINRVDITLQYFYDDFAE